MTPHTPSGQQAVEPWRVVQTTMAENAGDDNASRVARNILHALRNAGFTVSRTATPTAPSTDALRYAESIAIHLHANHYADVPHWEPLTGDLIGLLTQIDNMTVGLVRSPTAPSTAAGEMAFVCGCGWDGSYADMNETVEGMTCPKCRLGRNLDCAAALATPPAQEGTGNG
ncbi:hypothetical protein RQ831_18425 [Roseomonas gilardii]|uniref:Uncharacterized protein n=1 Tax=Roseomonas gilardii TaxID=257708 RepID=A0ABU3MKJ9_9PROT|nr:hypothetical protein [Roseomonas gilardii]MDT8333033.1 hypothetical protein [Roseomonas gilardii]